MSALASLVSAYERMRKHDEGTLPPFGYATQNIHACIVLNSDGGQVGPPVAWNKDEQGKPSSRSLDVPYFGGRSGSKAPPYFLWDNTAYVLGVSAKESYDPISRHAAFKEYHRNALEPEKDEALRALFLFLSQWEPERYQIAGFTDDLKDRNIVFRLVSDHCFVHDRDQAKAVWSKLYRPDVVGEGICLITGETSQIARLHPPIISFENPARIVSFDKDSDAFASYGKMQGANAPTGIKSAFAYTAVLNKFLFKGSRNRIQIGDASTIFWADASKAELAEEAEALFGAMLGGVNESVEASKIGEVLEKIRAGRPLSDKNVAPELAKGVRFYVLGLSPNAARLSMRFYMEDDFSVIAERFQRHAKAMRIDPPPKDANPSIWRCLIETAAQRKSENIPPQLAGEWLRAILTGCTYPLTLLATILMRLRADKDVNPLRVAMLKAMLISAQLAPRDPKSGKREVPVSLDPQNKDPGYLLGRLFAAYEYAQTQALPGVNATIRDKYYGTASATPRAVFPLLQRGSTHHLAKLRKEKPGFAINIDRKIADIYDLAEADKLFVPTLTAQKQAMFAVGYYHQRNDFYRRKDAAVEPDTATASEETTQ